MLDQENKTHVEHSTANTNNNNKVSSSDSSTSHNNPLSDHDYCSSQWLAAAEQTNVNALSEHVGNSREKRQRKEINDPEFSQFTSSSEYSSSDVESDQESEEDSDNDPNKPWCTCDRPDDGKFMIECEICKYWFHGSCVGMTASLSKKWAKENKEWFCSICDHALQSGTPRDAIPPRFKEKEKKKRTTKTVRRRGRPRKSESSVVREVTTRQSLRSTRRSNASIETRAESRSNARVESFKKFDDQQKLKELIRERKKEFFRKHRLKEQLKVDKSREMGAGRLSLTGPLGQSLDSCASNTSSPNMNNLPINIKSEHADRSKPNIVLQINTKKDRSSDASDQRIVKTIVKKRKTSESCDSNVNELFTAEPIQLSKRSKSQAERVTTPTLSKSKNSGDSTSPSREGKLSVDSEHQEQQSQQKRKRKESISTNGSSKNVDSAQIIQKIKECLEDRGKNLDGIDMSKVNVEELASEIEKQLHECFNGSTKYLSKYRSLIFNLRDQKNQALVRNVLTGGIPPSRLVRMSPDEMAPNELAKWRERENKHSIELIKRDAELAVQQVIVKKTHKGEEVIAAPVPNDPDDPTAAKEDQEIPSTPTKTTVKVENSKASPSPVTNDMSKTSTKNLNISFESASKKIDPESQPTLTVSLDEVHIKKEQNPSVEADVRPSTSEQDHAISHDSSAPKIVPLQEPKVDQPKRLTISIATRLDPANLSRLTEPLIKPSENPPDPIENSPSKMSPNADPVSNNNHDDVDDEEEELYDPETSTIPKRNSNEPKQHHSIDNCWTGTITMSEVGKFNAKAVPVSGNLEFMRQEISQTLMVCGRIAPDQVTTYIKKLKATTKSQIFLVQLHPLTENDKASFNTFFDYLYTRNRCGVMNYGGSSLKDFYVLPIHERGHIPEALKPINGPGLDRREPNCLLGLLVKPYRPNQNSSYTPSSIK